MVGDVLTADPQHDLMAEGDCVEPKYLKPAQAAKRIGVATEFIYDACASMGLKHTRLGGKRNIRITPAALDEWMKKSERVNE